VEFNKFKNEAHEKDETNDNTQPYVKDENLSNIQVPTPLKKKPLINKKIFQISRRKISINIALAVLLAFILIAVGTVGTYFFMKIRLVSPLGNSLMLEREANQRTSSILVTTFSKLKTTTASLNEAQNALTQTKGELEEAYSSLEKKKEEIKTLQIEKDTLNRVTEIDSIIQDDLSTAGYYMVKALQSLSYGWYSLASLYVNTALPYLEEAQSLGAERKRLLGW
jgi:hypothetical protein